MDINGQVVVLILFVVISGIQWLIKKIQGQGDQHESPGTLEDIYDEFREEIRQRQTTLQHPEPPPLDASHAAPPPLPGSPPPGVPSPSVPTGTPPTNVPSRQDPQADLTDAQKAAAERFQQLGRKKRRRSSSGGQVSARALLSNPRSARQAVILHEVFGKPKSMQEV